MTSVDANSFQLAKSVDLGDIVVAQGPLAKTKTGEITSWTTGEGSFQIASKSLAAPPGKWHGLQDAEQRYLEPWRERACGFEARCRDIESIGREFRALGKIAKGADGLGFLVLEV